MGIEMVPSEVVRSAHLVATAAEHVKRGDQPATSGNDGFTTSQAISRFAVAMHDTTSGAADRMSLVAQELEASARLMRRVDDDAEAVQRAIWTQLGSAS